MDRLRTGGRWASWAATWLLSAVLFFSAAQMLGGCGGVQWGQDTDEAMERASLPDRPTEPPDQDDPEDLAETTPVVTVPLESSDGDDGENSDATDEGEPESK